MKGAAIINLFPMFIRPYVRFLSLPPFVHNHHYRLYRFLGRLFTSVRSQIKRTTKHLAPIIQDRRRHIEEYGSDWEDKPVRLLTS